MPDSEATPTATETSVTETTTVEQRDAGGGGDDLDGLRSALEKERKARREAEKALKPLQQFHEERTKAEQTEAERLQARIKELEEREQQLTARERGMVLRDAIQTAASTDKITLHAPIGDVLKLIDADTVDWTEEGRPRNAVALLRDLVRERPYLASRRTGSADGGAHGPSGNPQDMNALLRAAAGRD